MIFPRLILSILLCILPFVPYWTASGKEDFLRPVYHCAIPYMKQPFQKLLDLTGLKKTEDFDQIIALTQGQVAGFSGWLRTGDGMTFQGDVGRFEQPEVTRILNRYGFNKMKKPRRRRYDAAFIMGSSGPQMASRFSYLKSLLEDGAKPIHVRTIYFLVEKRPLSLEVDGPWFHEVKNFIAVGNKTKNKEKMTSKGRDEQGQGVREIQVEDELANGVFTEADVAHLLIEKNRQFFQQKNIRDVRVFITPTLQSHNLATPGFKAFNPPRNGDAIGGIKTNIPLQLGGGIEASQRRLNHANQHDVRERFILSSSSSAEKRQCVANRESGMKGDQMSGVFANVTPNEILKKEKFGIVCQPGNYVLYSPPKEDEQDLEILKVQKRLQQAKDSEKKSMKEHEKGSEKKVDIISDQKNVGQEEAYDQKAESIYRKGVLQARGKRNERVKSSAKLKTANKETLPLHPNASGVFSSFTSSLPQQIFATSSKQKKTLLIVASQPYLNYYREVALGHFPNDRYQIDVIGLASSEPQSNRLVLESIAWTFYQHQKRVSEM